jgi:hypothetical protein
LRGLTPQASASTIPPPGRDLYFGANVITVVQILNVYGLGTIRY